jgi:hypothetical protein
MDPGVLGAAHRVDDPRAGLDRELGVRVGAHESVAEQFRQADFRSSFLRHDRGEVVDDPDRSGIALAVGKRREVLQVAEQERDLDGRQRATGLGGQRQLTEDDLGGLALEPAPVHGREEGVGHGQQPLQRHGVRRGPAQVAAVARAGLDSAHPELH